MLVPRAPGDTVNSVSTHIEASKQRLRLRRFLLASASSVFYLLTLAIYFSQHQVDLETLLAATAIVSAAIGALFLAFRLSLNVRFRDPSLTGLQIVVSVATMLFVVYRAPGTRSIFALFFFIALMFGMLRLTARQLTVIGCASLASFLGVVCARYALHGGGETLRLDLLQLLVSAITFPWLVFIGTRIKRLREADRRKDEFLATLAHELRNPLAPIRTGLQILQMSPAEEKPRAVLATMERQIQHLTRLLDELLDIGRITRGQAALHMQPVDLRQTLEAAIEASRPLIDLRRHALTTSFPEQSVTFEADPIRVAQIVSNLLNNAAQYTPPGGRIELTGRRLADAIEIVVTDNGIGIPRERLASIFDMFARLDESASDAHVGLGIGLSLVKRLVTSHGGTIEAHSEGKGRGSRFRVLLPARIPVPSPPLRKRQVDRRKTARKVLIVDDNQDAAGTLSMLVEMMGREARPAYDGESALRIARDWRPDVVLLDLGMPGLDGYEVSRRMRGEPWSEYTRIVAVTGWGHDEDRLRTSAAGFDGHLVKPVGPDELTAVLGEISPAATPEAPGS